MSLNYARILLCCFSIFSGDTIAQCIIQTGSLNFGNYQHYKDSLTTVTIDLNCPSDIMYKIKLSAGRGSYKSRKMQDNSGGQLLYNLYTRVDYAQIWGDGNAGTKIHTGIGIGRNQPLVIYGRIFANQKSQPGIYSDNIVITINF